MTILVACQTADEETFHEIFMRSERCYCALEDRRMHLRKVLVLQTPFSLLASAYSKTRAFDIRRGRGDKSPTTFPKASINLVFTHRERMKSFRTFNLPLHDSKEGRPCSLGMNLCLDKPSSDELLSGRRNIHCFENKNFYFFHVRLESERPSINLRLPRRLTIN